MKNVRISKKLLSMLTAGVLMATPVMAHNEEYREESTNDNEFTLIMQEKDFTPLTIEDVCLGVEYAYNYLKEFISYDTLQQDLQCLYYLTNREYMDSETEEELITSGIVYETDFNEQKYENFMRAYNLINVIADYNQSVIHKDYDNKCMNIEHLIDVSNICYGEADKKLVHNMHENYFKAYEAGRFDNEYYQMVFKQLTTLNAYEKAGNADELSVGARWLAQNSIGGGVMQLLRDDMQEDFTRKELDQYFVKSELNQGQWIVRDDISLDLNCLKNELEVEVFDFGQLWQFVYDDVNNDIMKTFEIDCTKRK